MRALHLPGLTVATNGKPPYSFPNEPAPASALEFTPEGFPEPEAAEGSDSGDGSDTVYKIRVLTTALTRGELSWSETLAPDRWRVHGGAVPGHDVVGIVVQK